MRLLEEAIEELYIYISDETEGRNHLNIAKDRLESALEFIGSTIASNELTELISELDGSNIEDIIHELELINMEL